MTDQQPPQSWGPTPPPPSWGAPGPGAPPPPAASRNGIPAWVLPIVACLCLAVGAVLGGAVVGSGDDDSDGEVATEDPTTTEDEPDPTDAPSEPPTDEEVDEPEEPTTTTTSTTTTEAQSSNPTFGETYEWDSGIAITVAPPVPFTPSESAVGGEGSPAYLQFDITITNGTDEPFDPALVLTTLQSGSVQAEQVYDSAQDFNGGPTTTVLPGRDIAYKVGFGVTEPDDLVLEIAPDFDQDATFFTS
jgi:hypothetical protein